MRVVAEDELVACLGSLGTWSKQGGVYNTVWPTGASCAFACSSLESGGNWSSGTIEDTTVIVQAGESEA